MLFKSLFEKFKFPTFADVAEIFHLCYVYHGGPRGGGRGGQFRCPRRLSCSDGFSSLGVFFPFLPNIRGAQVLSDLSHVLVLNTGLTSLHLSPLDRIVQKNYYDYIYDQFI